VHPFIEVLRREAKDFGPGLAKEAFARGLAVTSPDGSTRPIPITATPVIVAQHEIQRRVEISTRLASAALKLAKFILRSPQKELLLAALSPVERPIAEKTHDRVERLANTRVDYFVDESSPRSRVRALEVNATIPAMQAYSDIAANTLIEVIGRRASLSASNIEDLCSRNGSNALALYRALLEAFSAERQGQPARIALLCRRNDPQITELYYLAHQFRRFGTEAAVVFPDQLSGVDRVHADGRAYDLVYRHLFVRRLQEINSPYLMELFSEVPGRRAVLVNPPAAQVEVKTTFALLSQASVEPALARQAVLSEDELAAAREAVPWTRSFRRGAASDAEGRAIPDLVGWVTAHPERFVLKRAWDYGGKAVFVGLTAQEDSFRARTRAAYGADLSWSALCERAAEDPVGGGFVVQELIPNQTVSHLLCSEESVWPAELYVDFSAYASVNLERPPPWGGVCRGSSSPIVNIVGGGGVLPLLTQEVADALARHLQRDPVGGRE
jgi:hypothetical protein